MKKVRLVLGDIRGRGSPGHDFRVLKVTNSTAWKIGTNVSEQEVKDLIEHRRDVEVEIKEHRGS